MVLMNYGEENSGQSTIWPLFFGFLFLPFQVSKSLFLSRIFCLKCALIHINCLIKLVHKIFNYLFSDT